MSKKLFILLVLFASTINLWAQKKDNAPKKKPIELEFSLKGGFYQDPFKLELFSPGAVIYYTLDGSVPNRQAKIYKRSISIKKNTIIRAVAYKAKRKSKIKGHSYFINEPASTFPIISLMAAPELFFDPETGIFMKGNNAVDSIWSKPGANFWSRSENLMNCEFFEADGKCEFNSITGLRLFGGMSRLFPQKSMTIVTRDRYGKKLIKDKVFGKKGLKKFKFLVLRNSGSDWGKSHFRDAFMSSLVNDWDIEKQAYQPAHVYINGDYWGIYNIREKINRYFIAGHHDIGKDSIDLIEHRKSLKRGSTKHYKEMLEWLKTHDLSLPENYAHIQNLMDVDNFMNYQIAQIYFDNQDAGGNIKFWRPQTPNGKWRWILYDTDWGFGLHDSKAYKNNSLAFHTAKDGPSWPNPPWSTFILRKLLRNPNFEKQFITRFADHLNHSFESQLVVDRISSFHELIAPEMPRHLERWKLSKRKWLSHIGIMKEFAIKRPDYVREHLKQKFNLGALVPVKASATAGGEVIINKEVRIRTEGFSGKYFAGMPIHVKAVPNFGYRFSHWKGKKSADANYELNFTIKEGEYYNLIAVFEAYTDKQEGKILINEISCNNKKTGDWIELYNNSDESVPLENWVITDTKHDYKLPKLTIRPRSYAIICEDSVAFRKAFPKAFNLAGDMGFGLSKRKETLGLFSPHGASVDSMSYELQPMDTVFTLGLLLPQLDNSDIDNWEFIKGQGSPNRANPYFLESSIKAKQELWTRVGVGVGILLVCLLLLLMQRRRSNNLS